MKTLYIIRHAKAVDPSPGTEDFDRVLTPKGIQQAQEVANTLNKDLAKIDIIMTSPAARALATAEIIAQGVHYPVNRIKSIPEMFQASLNDLLEIIANIDPNIKSAMLVGHNPTISQLAQQMCNALKMDLSPCSVVVLAFDVQAWQEVIKHSGALLYIIQPK